LKLAQKRGKDMAKLREAILLLIEGSPLPSRYKGSAQDQIPRSFSSASADFNRLPRSAARIAFTVVALGTFTSKLRCRRRPESLDAIQKLLA
jgi:hypothetical protein